MTGVALSNGAHVHVRDGDRLRSTAQMLLNNHCQILLCIAEDPDVRLRDMADRVGITERAAFSIVNDLERNGVVTRSRHGRRNQYTIDRELKLHLPVGSACLVGDLIDTVLATAP